MSNLWNINLYLKTLKFFSRIEITKHLPECEIVSAELIDPKFLSKKENSEKNVSRFQLRRFKGSNVALFEFNGQQDNKYFLICRGVRFVNLLKSNFFLDLIFLDNYFIILTPNNEELILSQKYLNETKENQIQEGIKLSELVENEKENLFTDFYDLFNQAPSLDKRRCWLWSWQLQHQRDFGITNILNDENHPMGCATLKSINAALSVHKDK